MGKADQETDAEDEVSQDVTVVAALQKTEQGPVAAALLAVQDREETVLDSLQARPVHWEIKFEFVSLAEAHVVIYMVVENMKQNSVNRW